MPYKIMFFSACILQNLGYAQKHGVITTNFTKNSKDWDLDHLWKSIRPLAAPNTFLEKREGKCNDKIDEKIKYHSYRLGRVADCA